MKKSLLLFVIMLLLFVQCSKKKVEFETLSYSLPRIDSVEHKQCFLRYRNSLYDNNLLLKFKVNVIYIKPIKLLSVVESNSKHDSIIESNLNSGYNSQGIYFKVQESTNYYSNVGIEEFEKHILKYPKKDHINIFVYLNEDHPFWNGIAEGIPGLSIGILHSKIHTSTLIHEIGHILGLKHIFEKDDSDGLNSIYGDQICDTPSYNIMDHSTHNCRYVGKPHYSEEELKIIIPNYLNYNYQTVDCRDTFTDIQKLVIRWHIENFPQLQYCLY